MILWKMLKQMLGRSSGGRVDLPGAAEQRYFRRSDVPSVLVLTHSYCGNGAAEMLMFLLKDMVARHKWQVNALSVGLGEGDVRALKEAGVGLVEAIHPDQYDFAITNTVVSGLGHVERLSPHLPVVLWVHEGEFVLWNSQYPLGYWKRVFNAATHVVFQSRWQAERIFGSFTSTFPDNKYSIIQNCLPFLSEINPCPMPRKDGVKRIVFVGGVYERKRPGDLVEAIRVLGRSDVECILVGSTQHVDSLPDSARNLLKNDGRFVLLGEVGRDVATSYIASADVLCLPSGDESQPLVLLEAASLGVPVIISDLAVYRDMWEHGVNCLVHGVGDVEGLAGHIRTCLDGMAPNPVLRDSDGAGVDEFLRRFYFIFDRLLQSK